jgi:hemoglobin
LLEDPKLKDFFKNTDMKKQIIKQTQYITMVTGGPNNYEGIDMKKAHANLGIHKSQYDLSWFHMSKACHDVKIPAALIPKFK